MKQSKYYIRRRNYPSCRVHTRNAKITGCLATFFFFLSDRRHLKNVYGTREIR